MQLPLSTATRDRLAAGSFTSNGTRPVFTNPDLHPIQKVVDGDTASRIEQFFSSQKTEAILLAYKKKLYLLNVCALGFDLDADENEEHPVVSGGLGDEVATCLPAYIPCDELTADFLFLGTDDETKLFHRTQPLPDEFFVDAANPSAHALPRIAPGNLHIAPNFAALPSLKVPCLMSQ